MKMEDYYCQLGITREELDTLQEAFKMYDVTGKGYIEIEQFTHIIMELGIISNQLTLKQQQQQLKQIIEFTDFNKDNKIDLNEFILCMYRFIPYENTPIQDNKDTSLLKEKEDEELKACFQYFDRDHDGRISQKELEYVMNKFDTNLSLYEIKEMMLLADKNKDGFIDFDEFKQLLPPL